MDLSEHYSSSEDESEEEEPQLKYERIHNDILRILGNDAASCVAMHMKFVALGTHWGTVYILDHSGNTSKDFTSHNTQVTAISLDESGEYIASCSDDGHVVVTGLYSTDHNMKVNVDKPVKAVALDPNFAKGSAKQLVYGIDGLILFERGWLGRSKTTVLHTGEGFVRNIKWRGNLVAWSNDWGVKMYDMKQRRRITHIPRTGSKILRPELYPAHIAWKDDVTLLVGWANEIKVCTVKERRFRDLSREPDKYVEIVYHIPLDYACCGIAPFEKEIVILGYDLNSDDTDEGRDRKSERPQLIILEPDPIDGGYDEISCDALSVRGYQTYKCNNYSLAYERTEGTLYIVSPKDIVVARKRDKDDHVDWLISCKRYEEALQEVKQHGKQLRKNNATEIGIMYVEYLIEKKDFELAARKSKEVLGNDVEVWEEMVTKFIHAGQVASLYPYLPKDDIRLNPRCYDMVLSDLLKKDHQTFAKVIKEWPADLYNIAFVISLVHGRLDNYPEDTILHASLARLHALDHRYDRALKIYLHLRHPDTFELIKKHNLYDALKENVVLLMEFGKEQAVTLLLENTAHVPIEMVVAELQKHQEYLYMYLHALYKKDPLLGGNYHMLQVRLYAEFNRSELLPFFRSSNHYNLEEALQICEEREYTDETVFLLARMGNASKALSVIIDHYPDVFKAIEFCKEQNDMTLWIELIDRSINKPENIRDLLENIGTHVDPIVLIRRIPSGLRIPGLRNALVKILQDYSMQTSMWFQCKKILSSDVIALSKKQHEVHTKPICVNEETVCCACERPVLNSANADTSNLEISAFLCRHTFHASCLQYKKFCSICNGDRRDLTVAR